MKQSRLGALLTIPKRFVDVERIKKELLIPNGSYENSMKINGEAPVGMLKEFVCYKEIEGLPSDVDEGWISVPRNYSVPWLNGPLPARRKRQHFPTVEREINPQFVPRSHQPPAIEALAKPGDKIIAVKCGGGKTIITLAAWALHRTGPLLILVDTRELAKQWIAAAKLVCGIEADQIGSLKGPVEDWKGRSIVIGFVQTMWRRNYSRDLYRYFSEIAYDEVHICGASKMHLVLPQFEGERWGLSATPDRSDGNSVLIKLHMGEVTYEDLEQDLKPTVYFVQTPHKAPGWMSNMSKHVNAMVSSFLSKKKDRSKIILEYVERAAARAGRSVLTIGNRIALHQWLIANSSYQSECGLLVAAIPNPDDPKKRITMKDKDREFALTQRLLFATSQLASKALDKVELDTLIMPFPVGDANLIQQTFGRIQRVKEGKQPPIVVVFEDDVRCLIKSCDKIRAYCDKHEIEWKIIGKKNLVSEVSMKAQQQVFKKLKRSFGFKGKKTW